MKRCKAPLFIGRMVYTEVVVHKVVKRTTIKSTPTMVHFPSEVDIPQGVSFFLYRALERVLKRALQGLKKLK